MKYLINLKNFQFHQTLVHDSRYNRRLPVSDHRVSRYHGAASRCAESEASGSEETYESDSRCNDYYEDDEEDEDDDEDEDDEHSTTTSGSRTSTDDDDDVDEAEVAKALAAFRKCDEFLHRYRIRPEFFCRYRERLALQAWLLQRVTAKASRNISGEYYGELGTEFEIYFSKCA